MKFLVLLLILLTGTWSYADTRSNWQSCYDKKTKTLNFFVLGKKSAKGCKSSTQFKHPQGLSLIQDKSGPGGFSLTQPGSPKMLELSGGRSLLVSQWVERSSIVAQLLVIEPNLRAKKVRTLCKMKNFRKLYRTRYSSKKQTLYIQVKASGKAQPTWQACKL